MTRATNTETRPYRSRLRARQALATRDRILDAAVAVMARGVASLSVPAVAREADVGTRTVYHHFRTKEDLLAALYPHLMRRAGLPELVLPRSADELRDGLRSVFERFESLGEDGRAAVASPAADEARHLNVPARFAQTRQVVDAVAPALPEDARDRLARLLLVLTSSGAMRMWRDHLGSTIDEATGDIEWVLRSAIEANRSTHPDDGPR